MNWYTHGDNGETCYVQWKPVCYLDSQRGRAVGTEVVFYDLQEPSKVNGLESLLELSLAKAFFGDAMNESSAVMQMSTNVSFGLSQDGFYLKNNYTVWWALASIITSKCTYNIGAGIPYWYSAKLVIESLQAWAEQQENFLLQSLLSGLTLIQCPFHPMLLMLHLKDPGHSVKSACGRLHINRLTPLTQRSWSGLTMLQSRLSVGTS